MVVGFASQGSNWKWGFPLQGPCTEALPTSLRSKATNVDMSELSSYPLFRWWTTIVRCQVVRNFHWENSRKWTKVLVLAGVLNAQNMCMYDHVCIWSVYVASTYCFAPNQGQLFHTISRCLSLIFQEGFLLKYLPFLGTAPARPVSSPFRHLTFAACQLLLQGLAPRLKNSHWLKLGALVDIYQTGWYKLVYLVYIDVYRICHTTGTSFCIFNLADPILKDFRHGNGNGMSFPTQHGMKPRFLGATWNSIEYVCVCVILYMCALETTLVFPATPRCQVKIQVTVK